MLYKEVRELLHVFQEAIKASPRKDTLALPFRLAASILREEGMSDAVSKVVESRKVRRHPSRDIMDTIDQIELLKKV